MSRLPNNNLHEVATGDRNTLLFAHDWEIICRPTPDGNSWTYRIKGKLTREQYPWKLDDNRPLQRTATLIDCYQGGYYPQVLDGLGNIYELHDPKNSKQAWLLQGFKRRIADQRHLNIYSEDWMQDRFIRFWREQRNKREQERNENGKTHQSREDKKNLALLWDDSRKEPLMYYHNVLEKGLTRDRYAFGARQVFVRKYSWAIPNHDAIVSIRELNMPVLEVGCGSGYWSWELQQAGVDVVATDIDVGENHKWGHDEGWLPIEHGHGAAMAKKYAKTHALLVCWPDFRPEGGKWAEHALKAYLKNGGKCVIYVGEPDGGCTGTREFHDELYKNWRAIDDKEDEGWSRGVEIPQWDGIHDRMWIYKRK